VAQNRLRLFVVVGCIRIVENLFLAVLLPRTVFASHATGHAREGVEIWQLRPLLFSVGAGDAAAVCTTPYYNISSDWKSVILNGLSVIGVSVILLLAQAVTLHGSYLAVTGYICGEWIEVADLQTESENNRTGTSNSSNPSVWDPKRKYKKGDIVAVNRPFSFPRQVFYKATSNAPEGKPFDVYLRATHDMFRNELGHPSTSKLLANAIHFYLMFIAVLVLDVLASGLGSDSSQGKLYALAGNVVACYGAVKAGLTKSSEIRRIADEVVH
jgi:hypothetical protein